MSNQLLAICIVIVTAKLYMDHRKKNYDGPYNDSGIYKNISPMKHDLFKQLILKLFPLLVFGVGKSKKLYDPENALNSDSFVGKLFIGLISFFIYYQLVEPYINEKIPRF